MISWQSIMSVFNTKGTLLKWLKTLDKSLKDGVLESVTVNSVSEGVITLSFNFADGSVITTPNIDIPQGAKGDPGEQGPPGVPGPAGSDLFSDFSSLKIDTTDATVSYINGVATITNARLIGYKSVGNEEVEIAVDLPIKAGDNVTVDASEDDKSILISAQGPNIPTPTTADNGKVLGVTNGAYALQEASGGGGAWVDLGSGTGGHNESTKTIELTFQGDFSQYHDFYLRWYSSDGDGTTFLKFGLYMPGAGFLPEGISSSVCQEELPSGNKNYINLWATYMLTRNSTFIIKIYNVPDAPDGIFGPGYHFFGKK